MWAKTVASKLTEWMPLDAAPVTGGNVIVFRDPDAPRRLVCDVIGRPRVRLGMAADGWSFWQHHRLSCPFADRWARSKVHERPTPTGIAPAPTVDTPDPEPERTLW